jgi:hypothetical protein
VQLWKCILVLSASGALAAPGAYSQTAVSATAISKHSTSRPALDEGFHLLYSLKFEEGRARIADDIRQFPDDPHGHAALAASYLFEEFYRQGVLSSEFFLDDKRFLEGIEGKPDEKRKQAFLGANMEAQQLAARCLTKNQNDTDALLALSLTSGMQADYLAVLERKQVASLKYIKEAEGNAKRLLALRPDEVEAYLPLGVSNYIIGSLPGYKRFFLWFGGIRGQKELGIEQLKKAASGGHHIQPFAKILLALALLREKQPVKARILLEELAAEFPQNHLFPKELALLNSKERRSPAEQSNQ